MSTYKKIKLLEIIETGPVNSHHVWNNVYFWNLSLGEHSFKILNGILFCIGPTMFQISQSEFIQIQN